MKKWMNWLILTILLFVPLLGASASAKGASVYEVPLNQNVEKGLYAFLQRSFEEAEKAGADRIIIRMDTPGGFTDSAEKIGQLFRQTEQEIIVFIEDNAISAGAFIALNADAIYMTPQGKIGAAQVIQGDGNAAGDKAESAWNAAMINAAKSSKHKRNPIYAEAMSNPEIDLPKYRAPVGKLLTLTAEEAKEVGYAEGIFNNYEALLNHLNIEASSIIQIDPTFTEKLARFITDPIIVPILLSIAGLGLVVELYSPGFGVAGTMGLASIALFFFGHLVAGLAGYETLLIFLLGLGLVIAELFVAGGILGVSGAILIGLSIIMAGQDPMQMTIAVLIALIVIILGVIILMKFFGKRLHLLNKMVLMDSTSTDQGYVSNENRTELIDQVGKTLTPLRPAGVVSLNGERLDVVSDGSYIDKGVEVKVIEVEGSKIVVAETAE